jgi:4-hydroxy-2-oxoglutarate aldolase
MDSRTSRPNHSVKELRGVFAPLTAPFHSSGDVDPERLRENIARYNKTALAGYAINGSTGESVLLRWIEVEQLWAAAAESAAPDKFLLAGSGAESTIETIEMTRRAASIGYHAALVRTPSYYKPQMTEDAEAAHFLRVADASPIPVVLYSVPIFTGYTMEAPLAARLAAHPNIIGMKDSSGDAARAEGILSAVPPDFRLLVGSAPLLAATARKGAAGAILAMACVFPEMCAEIYEAAAADDPERAERLQRKLSAASAVISRAGIPGIKCAMDARGYYGGPSRMPLLPLDPRQRAEVEESAAATGGVAV